jgi:HEAT repeat protein
MKCWALILLSVATVGCGRSEPALSGGHSVGYWIEALQNPDAKLRKKAVAKLGNAGPVDAAVYPSLIAALKDADASVRRETILALMKFGPEAREAVPVLTVLQRQDRDEQVRSFAAKALEKLGNLPD